MLSSIYTAILVVGLVLLAIVVVIVKMYKKAVQGEALIKTGQGGAKVSFSGIFIVPVIHKLEIMDITLKSLTISRLGKDGLICKDNMRADIKVSFFIRVNKTTEDVIHVAQSIGCKRASDIDQLEMLFDAKFSEALKTVGKHFEFVELYNSRAAFKERILDEIGTDLNGYILDDCAIDYVEQTSIHDLNESNILDAQGIKKIIELTSTEKIKSNLIEREKEKTIKKQDVEARETILELEKQQTEKEEQQRREIENIRSRESAEIEKVRQENEMKAAQARIATEEEVGVAEENKLRQIVVALKNKEKTEAVETERVEQARALEATERERVVELARIDKEKSLEVERRNIQEVIRERVTVEKATVAEEEKIKDTRAQAEADRNKMVAITIAEQKAEEALVQEIKAAEAARQAADSLAKKSLIDAEAEKAAANHKAEAIKTLADAEAAQKAAIGMSEAQVMSAKAEAKEKEGESEASVIEMKADAEAKGIRLKAIAQSEADEKLGFVAAKVTREKGTADAEVTEVKAVADEKKGMAEARVMAEKFKADAEGIKQKAAAMKALDGAGVEHEEFKLKLEKDRVIELAQIDVSKHIAEAQALVLAEAMKSAKIDIIGGESMFFNQIAGSVAKGKSIDAFINGSEVATDVKSAFLSTDGGSSFKENVGELLKSFNLTSEDVKNITISALLFKMMGSTQDDSVKNSLRQMMSVAKSAGLDNETPRTLGLI
ncbi:flotillin family protein [Fulvivirga sediminis]|uniref:Flotillin family protein n=1 Tax=Fulvivirga sediminis TaxID=2803949 RepID=A0A937K0B7_9BACT|nr:flotillin family protein [Fulvivirga sediminis]MBL3656156.1 flotillin family protein [Fulvivirga sediminis]